MKNKIIASLSFLLLVAGTAFAGTTPLNTKDGDTSSPFTFKQSNNVTIAYAVGGTTSAQKYAAASKNKAGDKFFSTSNDNSNIYFKQDTTYIGLDATNTVATTAVGTGVLTSTGWTSQ